jgi:hypothetical protein
MWLWSAERLYYAAEVVWDVAWKAEVAMFQGKRSENPAARGQFPTALLLFGYAFENAIKGLIVQRLVANGQTVVTDGKLPRFLVSHNTPKLAVEHAKLGLDAEAKNLLCRLSTYTVWAGRYPVMTDASEYQAGQLLPGTLFHPATDKPLIAATFETILANYEKRFVRLKSLG